MRPASTPPCFPPAWATGWGEDACGLWIALGFGGVRQVFRWITPGCFVLGTAKEETAGLFLAGDETRREASLTQGLWLADTAVTQELWQAVMQINPSGFLGPRLPVERVSWADAQRFLARLNRLIPGLAARLPTEAEWECACRAGTAVPYAFGTQIGPDQVNCRHRGAGIYRRRTVEVRSLPANAWGLYEMHGNVWEWCQDSWPNGGCAASICLHAVRGGSWACAAAYVRSASRDRFPGDWNGSSTGLRLAI